MQWFSQRFLFLALIVMIQLSAQVRGLQGEPRGLPFIRTYPLDEIGTVPRALRLAFDSFGRVAVMYDGVYSVLNDATWVDRIDPSFEPKSVLTSIVFHDGVYYYGGRGSWGTIAMTESGLFRAHSLVPPDAPNWTAVTAFNGILPVSGGIFFYDINGAVYFDFAKKRNFFFPLPRVNAMFEVKGKTYACCEDRSVYEIVLSKMAAEPSDIAKELDAFVSAAARLDEQHEILLTRSGHLYTFDGTAVKPWDAQHKYHLEGRVSAITHLVEGGVALAVKEEGIYIFSETSELRWSLHFPEFRRVSTMASGEAGVLWAAGENAVHKVFYDSPLTSFGEELGLTAEWPQAVESEGRTYVCSNRTIYELVSGENGQPSRFRSVKNAPEGCNCAATSQNLFLVGTVNGVFSREASGDYKLIEPFKNVMALEFIRPDTCIVVGTEEIAALRYNDGWKEIAPRIAGVGDAPIRTLLHHDLWLEMGGDRVMRIRLDDNRLHAEKVQPPWKGARWTNLGVIGKWLIFSDSSGRRAYYDEPTNSFRDVPQLDRLLGSAPYWITRVTEDTTGVLWATHSHGVVTFEPKDGWYVVDASRFELRNDSYPTITLLPSSGAWILTGRSLYHVEKREGVQQPHVHPLLVSLISEHKNKELISSTSNQPGISNFAFNDNNLSFRFFSGTYAWRNPPLYEYRLGTSDPWVPLDRSLLLHFPKLEDGQYHLQIRLSEKVKSPAPVFGFAFKIRPPWYRTPMSYAGYIIAGALFIFILVRWTNHYSLMRNASLEALVAERTNLLEQTMHRLEEETRHRATIAERNRLAGEIHDSLQQGVSGSIIQLDTTLANAEFSVDARSRLDVVRNMLSYIREEIQHAVWNLESPLLQDSSLGEALKKLAGFINARKHRIEVVVPDAPITFEPGVQHNLLRIAQEAITNAVKHSNANCIKVVLSVENGAVSLAVSDNGNGFDPAKSSNMARHFGLRGMRTRAKSIKADLQVLSEINQGTTVVARVPVEQSKLYEPAL